MTDIDKLTMLRSVLGVGVDNFEHDATLRVYLNLAEQEILAWLYSVCGGVPTTVTRVPKAYEVTQIMACAAGFAKQGADDEVARTENGVVSRWEHADMVAYIRDNVVPYVGFGVPRMTVADGDCSLHANETKAITVYGSIGALSADVNNPEAVSVAIDTATVAITGLAYGASDVVVKDELGRTVTITAVVLA